jgi:putative endonuclease
MSISTTHNLSTIGENVAASHLLRCGYTVVCRNFRKPCGEIDLIVEKDQRLVFCEVKTRTYHSMETALSSVNISKQRKISRTAQIYVNQNPQYGNHYFRFDVIVVFYYPETDSFEVRHIEDAFYPILDN